MAYAQPDFLTEQCRLDQAAKAAEQAGKPAPQKKSSDDCDSDEDDENRFVPG